MRHWQWRDEADPPVARGAIGFGAAAHALLARARAQAREATSTPIWQVTAHRDALILIAKDNAAEALPWTAGVAYLAPRPEAPTLWLPTTRRPDVPLDLLVRAIAQRHPPGGAMVLWPAPAQLIPLHRLAPADADTLARIAARWEAVA